MTAAEIRDDCIHFTVKQLKPSPMSAPTFSLPDLTKPFELFTHETLNVSLGGAAQRLGNQRGLWPTFPNS